MGDVAIGAGARVFAGSMLIYCSVPPHAIVGGWGGSDEDVPRRTRRTVNDCWQFGCDSQAHSARLMVAMVPGGASARELAFMWRRGCADVRMDGHTDSTCLHVPTKRWRSGWHTEIDRGAQHSGHSKRGIEK